MRKLTYRFFFFVLLVLIGACSATVKPRIEYLAASSDLVVTGRVTAVDQDDARTRSITVQTDSFLKAHPSFRPGRVVFLYHDRDKNFLQFDRMRRLQEKRIFFLRFVPDDAMLAQRFHLELTDAWFGVEPITDSALSRIQRQTGDG